MRIGLCSHCSQPVAAEYEIRDDCVYLNKKCPSCGVSSVLVSGDAHKWEWKRQLADFHEPGDTGCDMACAHCDHQMLTPPYTVAIDVTNRCNQRCPICLANVEAMGFDFNPPMVYFKKIFEHFKHAQPRPNICFFGGEPTVRDDFPELVRLAKSYGFQVQLFTNGLKFANPEYTREVCSAGIQVNFGFDGTRNDIYEKLRGHSTLELKQKALDNIISVGVNKLVLSSTMAEGVNDDNIPEMLRYIHKYRDVVSVWAFVPLTPCWEPGAVDLKPTTTECVEAMFEKRVPGMEWVPTGMMKFSILSRFFGRQTLGGSHPNCESATLLVSDGEKYHPISNFMKIPLSLLLQKLQRYDRQLSAISESLSPDGLRRFLFNLRTFLGTLKIMSSAVNLRAFLARPVVGHAILVVWDLMRGNKIDKILNQRTSFKQVLTLMTIPYEDPGGVEDARLRDCPAVFAYEDISTGRIRTTAFCSWQLIKDDICRKIQNHYTEMEARAK